MKKFKTVLFATDLTENSRSYFGVSAQLASQLRSNIILLHVMERLQETYEGIAVAIFGEERWRTILYDHKQSTSHNGYEEDPEKQIVRVVLGEFCRDVDKKSKEFRDIKRNIVISEGGIVEEIIRQAEFNKCDLIVMGTSRGYSSGISISPFIKSVLRKSGVPVFVTPLPLYL